MASLDKGSEEVKCSKPLGVDTAEICLHVTFPSEVLAHVSQFTLRH